MFSLTDFLNISENLFVLLTRHVAINSWKHGKCFVFPNYKTGNHPFVNSNEFERGCAERNETLFDSFPLPFATRTYLSYLFLNRLTSISQLNKRELSRFLSVVMSL